MTLIYVSSGDIIVSNTVANATSNKPNILLIPPSNILLEFNPPLSVLFDFISNALMIPVSISRQIVVINAVSQISQPPNASTTILETKHNIYLIFFPCPLFSPQVVL